MATGSPEHFMLDRNHDYWGTRFYWVNPIVRDYLADVIEDNLDEVF